tara:strand:+ start:239 stop:490 length:252 start_codon:yes stop_codon:yes gene_type:complete
MEDHLLFRDILEVVDQLRIVIEDLVVVVLLLLVIGVEVLMDQDLLQDRKVVRELLFLHSLIQHVSVHRLYPLLQPLLIRYLDM